MFLFSINHVISIMYVIARLVILIIIAILLEES